MFKFVVVKSKKGLKKVCKIVHQVGSKMHVFTLVIQFNTQDNRNENIKLINLIF